ncbi:4Fe-4S binding protein [Methanobrevibacter arboriphilus]|nr:4Fe-4S binding protein [Methanobrevibacter arboriphilus]
MIIQEGCKNCGECQEVCPMGCIIEDEEDID